MDRRLASSQETSSTSENLWKFFVLNSDDIIDIDPSFRQIPFPETIWAYVNHPLNKIIASTPSSSELKVQVDKSSAFNI